MEAHFPDHFLKRTTYRLFALAYRHCVLIVQRFAIYHFHLFLLCQAGGAFLILAFDINQDCGNFLEIGFFKTVRSSATYLVFLSFSGQGSSDMAGARRHSRKMLVFIQAI